MSNRQLVIELLQRLPEDVSLAEIAREVELIAGIEIARAEARRGEGQDVETVLKEVDEWLAE